MRKIIYFIFASLILVSCSTYKYNTMRDEKIDFTQYRTYAWLPPIDSLSKSYFDNDIARTNILGLSNSELTRRNLTLTKDKPDLLFRFITIVNNKSRLVYGTSYNYGGPWGWYRPWFSPYYGYSSYPVAKERYRYGHVIIEALDAKTNKIIWVGRGSGEVTSPERATSDVNKIIKGIFKKYPVKSN